MEGSSALQFRTEGGGLRGGATEIDLLRARKEVEPGNQMSRIYVIRMYPLQELESEPDWVVQFIDADRG